MWRADPLACHRPPVAYNTTVMQQDFHFNVVYLLCRCAGFGPSEARTVASASQFADDCAPAGELRRPNGASCRPEATTCTGPLALDRAWQERTLRRYHFLADDRRPGVVTPGNRAVTRLARKAAVLAASAAPYGLHALGLALHALADSFAHQGFSPFAGPLNRVRRLTLEPSDGNLLGRIQGFFLHQFPHLAPAIGHAEAGFCPDVPFLTWSYRLPGESSWRRGTWEGVRFQNGRVVRDNAVIVAAAVRAVAGVLAGVDGLEAARDPNEQAAFFNPSLFRRLDSLQGRSGQWEAVFHGEKFFGFRGAGDRRCFSYDGKEWGGRAYGFAASPRGAAMVALRRGYRSTDWWRFQQAVRWMSRSQADDQGGR